MYTTVKKALIIATEETHSVRDFLQVAFSHVDLDWWDYVETDPKYYRPTEVDLLVGDASKAKRILGWEARTTFKDVVRLMVDADIGALKRQEWEEVRSHAMGR